MTYGKTKHNETKLRPSTDDKLRPMWHRRRIFKVIKRLEQLWCLKKKKHLAFRDSFSLQSHNESNKTWNSWKEKEKDNFWQLSY